MLLQVSPLLRRALLVDAYVSGATGLLMFVGASPLASVLDLPEDLVRYAGLLLIPFAGWAAYLARQETPPRWSIVAVVAINTLWALDSLLLVSSGWVAPNPLGIAFVAAQALVVAAFAAVQVIGLRGSVARVAIA